MKYSIEIFKNETDSILINQVEYFECVGAESIYYETENFMDEIKLEPTDKIIIKIEQ